MIINTSIDGKGRAVVPKLIREALGEPERIIFIIGSKGCLVRASTEWLGVSIAVNGRVVIPQYVRTALNLHSRADARWTWDEDEQTLWLSNPKGER